MSTVSDKNKLEDVNFRKFTGVIVVCCLDEKYQMFNFAELNLYVRLVHIQNYFYFFIS